MAAHYWFVIDRGTHVDRWEIWQDADAGGESWGHLHKNLKPFDQGVGNGGSWVEKEWCGADADKITAVLEAAPMSYAGRDQYRYWPGPNSNTFVQWVLSQAGSEHTIGPLGVGKGYLRVWKPAKNRFS